MTTKLEQEIEQNREALAEAREEEKALKAEIDGLPEEIREAVKRGREKASEAHKNGASRADVVEIAEAEPRRAERAGRLLKSQYREARARVQDLTAQSWSLERARVRAELETSDLDQREEKARERLVEAQAELEAVQRERSRFEGADNRAVRERHNVLRMAKALRSGEADSDGFGGVR